MAWRSHGTTNEELITKLKKNLIITNSRVAKAMSEVDRGNFCRNNPYQDAPQSIGYAVTISAPHMHAYALNQLKDQLKEGSKALDVGSGSGYLTACMAVMVGETGRVIGVEHMPDLVELSKQNIRKGNAHLLDSGRLKIFGVYHLLLFHMCG